MSRVLVTGAGGFIGRRLVRALFARGHSVVAATHRPQPADDPEVQTVTGDLKDGRGLSAWPKDVEIIVHAAADRLDSDTDWASVADLLRVNTLGTLHVLSYAEMIGVKRIVYCSSLAVYALPQPLPIQEEGATYPVQAPDSFYGISKLGGELLCARLQHEGRLSCLCLRLARVYGPEEDPNTLLSRWVRSAGEGRSFAVYGDGKRSLDFLYIEDAVQGLVAAVESPSASGVMNLGSGRETTWRELAQTVIEVFAQPKSTRLVRYVPEGSLTRCFLDISKASGALGFSARYSLRDGLIAWRDTALVTASEK